MPNYLQLQAQIEKLQKEAETLRQREIKETIAKIKKAIAVFGLTAQDLGLAGGAAGGGKASKKAAGAKRRGRPPKAGVGKQAKTAKAGKAKAAKRGRKAGKKIAKKSGKLDKRSVVAPKYRDASTGATWTGRGKQPRWLAEAIKGGKKLADFLI